MKSLSGALVLLALMLAACGDAPKPSVAASEQVSRGSPDERAVRATLADFFRFNSTGDYDAVCALMTLDEQRRAAKEHHPGSTNCTDAFQAEADGLGDSLADANAIYAGAKIESVAINNGVAVAVVDYGGGSEPATAKLEQVGSRWLLAEEP